MIQINLLPEVKTSYIKAQRKKRIVLISAATVSSAALAIVIILSSYVYIGQKVQLNTLDKNIKSSSTELSKISGLNKILTIQNQLNSLTDLHKQKPVTSRLLGYLQNIVPTDIHVSNMDVSFTDSTMTFTGTAKSLESVNKFVDTLKFADYTVDKNTDKKSAFSEVVLTAFSRSDKEATYTISLKFDPAIFSSDAKAVTVSVPKITSTRSNTEQPEALFKEPESTTNTSTTR